MSFGKLRSLRAATLASLESVPGLVHGFEQRLGPPGWESREQARRRVTTALSTEGQVMFLKQVHGARVLEAPWEGTPEGDAATVGRGGVIVGVETADCLPILVVDPVDHRAAAVHAGWRGTAAAVARCAVEALVEQGSDPHRLLAALGPAIGPCCYEVGDELRAHFGNDGAAFFRPGTRGRPHFDLRAANLRQLEYAGIPARHIHHIDHCTFCRADLYYSFRRDGKASGRMVSFVGFRASVEP